jgi:hypothetical protein
MRDFLLFRRMVTPLIIQLLFWLAFLGVVLGGSVAFLVGLIRADVELLVGSVLVVTLSPLVLRIYAELLILLFRINETLTDILVELRAARER